MTAAARGARHGAVTVAAKRRHDHRRARARRATCSAWSQGDFAIVGEDLYEVASGVLERLLGGGGELVTLVAGAEAGDLAEPARRGSSARIPASTSWSTRAARTATRCWWRWSSRGRQVSWDSPVAAVGGKHASKIVKADRRRDGRRPARHLPAPLRAQGVAQRARRAAARATCCRWSARWSARAEDLPGPAYPPHGVPPRGAGARRGRQPAAHLLRRQKHTADWRATRSWRSGRVGLFVGRLKWFSDQWQLTNPESRMYGDDAERRLDAMPDLIPIYPAVGRGQHLAPRGRHRARARPRRGRPRRAARRRCARPRTCSTIAQALRWIHRPDTWAQKVSAEKRLKYDEAFVAQTVLARRRAAIEAHRRQPASRCGRAGCSTGSTSGCRSRSPTASAPSARRSPAELGQGHPMHRLLQGEVGSGKTVVALRAMLQVVDSGGQAALLAPDRGARPAAPPLDRRRCSATSPRAASSAAPRTAPGSRC